jgi:hypothetical protein
MKSANNILNMFSHLEKMKYGAPQGLILGRLLPKYTYIIFLQECMPYQNLYYFTL